MGTIAIAIILGLVEGITEFLPISSTGHLILAGHALGFTGEKSETFEIVIQLGAILAVVALFWRRFLGLFRPAPRGGFGGMRGMVLLAITTAPALVVGAATHHFIKAHLFSPATVAIGLGLGGLAILVVEALLPKPRKRGVDAVDAKDALVVGLFQCLALWPGMSRSACTMIGGMLFGLERRTVAEYSFLAAVPVMFAATFFDLYKSRHLLSSADIPLFAVGFLVAFVSAWLAVKYFLGFIGTHTLKGFGWYRLALAAAVFALVYAGWFR